MAISLVSTFTVTIEFFKSLMSPSATFGDRMSMPPGWSEERYEEAAKHLPTWDMDFKWTKEQHRIGSQFAAKHCTKQERVQDDSKLCEGKTSTAQAIDQPPINQPAMDKSSTVR